MDDIKKAKDICKRLEQAHIGKIAAIELESGDSFVADTEIEAYEKAAHKYPNKQFIFQRIGFPATHFVGLR